MLHCFDSLKLCRQTTTGAPRFLSATAELLVKWRSQLVFSSVYTTFWLRAAIVSGRCRVAMETVTSDGVSRPSASVEDACFVVIIRRHGCCCCCCCLCWKVCPHLVTCCPVVRVSSRRLVAKTTTRLSRTILLRKMQPRASPRRDVQNTNRVAFSQTSVISILTRSLLASSLN